MSRIRESIEAKRLRLHPLPRYFTQRPAPGCFHAITFGTCYSPRGAYPGVISEMYDIPEEYRAERAKNIVAQPVGREMFIAHDGSIADIFGTSHVFIEPGVYPRSKGCNFTDSRPRRTSISG